MGVEVPSIAARRIIPLLFVGIGAGLLAGDSNLPFFSNQHVWFTAGVVYLLLGLFLGASVNGLLPATITFRRVLGITIVGVGAVVAIHLWQLHASSGVSVSADGLVLPLLFHPRFQVAYVVAMLIPIGFSTSAHRRRILVAIAILPFVLMTGWALVFLQFRHAGFVIGGSYLLIGLIVGTPAYVGIRLVRDDLTESRGLGPITE